MQLGDLVVFFLTFYMMPNAAMAGCDINTNCLKKIQHRPFILSLLTASKQTDWQMKVKMVIGVQVSI